MKKVIMTLTYGRVWAAFVAAFCCTIVLYAQPISEQQAMGRALQYMSSNRSTANARQMMAPALSGNKKLTPTTTKAEKIYAFNIDGGGFIIASGDQRTLPVLGYSTTGNIDWEQMPENMRSWLKQYDEAIATLGNRTDFEDGEQITTLQYGQANSTARTSSRAERAKLDPLIKTHWDQAEPYWNQVPTYQGAIPSQRGKQCYVGCVATAMAQVMNYWQWPKTLPDGLPEYDFIDGYNGLTKTWHIGALPPTWFDWDNMLDDYYSIDSTSGEIKRLETTEAQNKAVATLMRYCGQSVRMNYGPGELGGSASSIVYAAKALVDYFDYNAAQIISRQKFPGIDEWEEIIYGELAAGRPIVYSGQSDQGGHAFVCDGYDGNGLFHINWGWSGYNDGYFALAVLNPYNNTSAGSGSSGIGYCIQEGAIIYTDPKMEKQSMLHHDFGSSFYQYAPIILYEDNEVMVTYSFYETHNEVADHALGTIDEEGNLHPLIMVAPNDSIVYSYETHECNYFFVQIDSSYISPGQTVTLYPMLRFRHPGEQWQIIPPMEQNLTVGRDENGTLFMRSNQKPYDMQMLDVAITSGTGRLDERSDVTIRVNNSEATDYIDNLYLVPVYLGHVDPEDVGKVPALAYGEKMSCGAYIPAHGEADVTFSFVPEYGGTVVFCAYNKNKEIGEMPLELNNDTLINYNPYVENKSYMSRDGDQWYWNVEFADRQGVSMSHWIPSDSLVFRITQMFNNDCLQKIILKKELHDYLMALPDSIGSGEYIFRYQLPIDLNQPGDYYLDSYISYLVNGERLDYSAAKVQLFTIDSPNTTGIIETKNAEQAEGDWYDMSGRRLAAKPTSKGIYIYKGKKRIIK